MKTIILCLLLAVTSAAQVKKPEPPPVKVPFAESLQAVVVTTKDWNATQGTALLFERKTKASKWRRVGEPFQIVVGRSGLATTREDAWQMDLTTLRGLLKKEGDGKSPAGLLPLTYSFGTAEKAAGSKVPYKKIENFVECVDDTNSNHYNKIVNRMQVGAFDWKSSEKMIEIVPDYDLGVFVAYNSYPIVSGNGSCIFLHIWKDANSPTSGCTAMEKASLEKIVGWLDAKKNPYLVQLPEDQYQQYQKSWNLPKIK